MCSCSLKKNLHRLRFGGTMITFLLQQLMKHTCMRYTAPNTLKLSNPQLIREVSTLLRLWEGKSLGSVKGGHGIREKSLVPEGIYHSIAFFCKSLTSAHFMVHYIAGGSPAARSSAAGERRAPQAVSVRTQSWRLPAERSQRPKHLYRPLRSFEV